MSTLTARASIVPSLINPSMNSQHSSSAANSPANRLTVDAHSASHHNLLYPPSTLTTSASASPLHSQTNTNYTQPGAIRESYSTSNLSSLHHSRPSCVSLLGLHAEEDHYHYPCTEDGYDIYAEIGVGAFATVYRAVCKENGEEVAIKIIDLEQFNTNWDEIRREILIMSLLNHPNVVKIKTSFVSGQDLWIIMPLLQAGSCAALMKQLAPNGFKDEVLIATILKETLLALVYFHKDRRIHRDLKAGNILVGADGTIELADFGVAGTLMENGDRKTNRQTFTGTPCWMAPEVMEHTAGYDEKADMWSFGITALELGYGRAPYARFQPMKVILLTLQEDPPTAEVYKDRSHEFSKHYHSMIAKTLRKDPKQRPTAKKLLEHKFFKQAKDKQYIIDHLVSKLPPPQPLTEKVHICRSKLTHDQQRSEKNKPVSIGSWEFDRAEFEEFKRRANEEDGDILAKRQQAVDSSYHVHGNSTPPTPISPNHQQQVQQQEEHNFEQYNHINGHELNDQMDNEPRQPIPNDLYESSQDDLQQQQQQVNDNGQGQESAPLREHREGRFFVSDEDNADNPSVNNSSLNQGGDNQLPEFHDQVDRGTSLPDQNHLHFDSGDYLDDPNSTSFQGGNEEYNLQHNNNPQQSTEEGSEQVGRFSIMDEEDNTQQQQE